MLRTLYHFDACPDCEKVRTALAIERIPYESFRIDPGDRAPVRRASGQESVPVLVEDDGRVFADANRILRHLAGRPGSKLLPDGRRDQALTWVLVSHADGVLGPLCRRLTARKDSDGNPLRDDDVRVLERRFDEEIAVLEGILERGPFLFGDRPTLADVAIHAFVRRLDQAGARSIPEDCVRAAAWHRRMDAAGAVSEP